MKLFDETKSGKVREAVHAVVKDWAGVEAKPMMGCSGWRAECKLFVSVIDADVMLHTLTGAQRAEAKAKVGGGPFRPAPGRSMDSWVVVPASPATVPKLEPWLKKCYEAAMRKAEEKGKERKAKKS